VLNNLNRRFTRKSRDASLKVTNTSLAGVAVDDVGVDPVINLNIRWGESVLLKLLLKKILLADSDLLKLRVARTAG